MENYIDTTTLLSFIFSEDIDEHQLIASVDRNKVEQDVLEDGEPPFQSFQCTDEPRRDENWKKMHDGDDERLNQLHDSIRGGKTEIKRSIKQLIKLKKKYPNVPTIYNFLAVAYSHLGNTIKTYHMLKETHKKFPDYLFGKITLAEYRMNVGHYEEVPDILDHKLQLYLHYPDVKGVPTFHISEVGSFYTLLGRYYIRNSQTARALQCYFLVSEICKENESVHILAKDIVAFGAANLAKNNFERLGVGGLT